MKNVTSSNKKTPPDVTSEGVSSPRPFGASAKPERFAEPSAKRAGRRIGLYEETGLLFPAGFSGKTSLIRFFYLFNQTSGFPGQAGE